MTLIEFNQKWKKHIYKRYPGLQIDDARVIEYCDTKFEQIIHIYPFFYCTSIHNRYGITRCNIVNVIEEVGEEIVREIDEILNS